MVVGFVFGVIIIVGVFIALIFNSTKTSMPTGLNNTSKIDEYNSKYDPNSEIDDDNIYTSPNYYYVPYNIYNYLSPFDYENDYKKV